MIKRSYSYKVNSSIIKYFLVQALGSFFILYRFIIRKRGVYSLFIVLGLLIKLGNPPRFIWLPRVIKRLEWYRAIILSTFQKFPPLLIFSIVGESGVGVLLLIIIGFIVRGLGGVIQTHLLSLIAFSSMSHVRWVLLGIKLNVYIGWVYFLVYSLRVMVLFSLLNSLKWYKLRELRGNLLFMGLVIIILISIAGLPPLLGFFPKLFIFQSLLDFRVFSVVFILSFMIFNLDFYSNIVFLVYRKLGLGGRNGGRISLNFRLYWGAVILIIGGGLIYV